MTGPAIKVTLLGTGTPTPQIYRFGPSTLVEAGGERFLFDCGRGATQRLLQIDAPFTEIDKLFLTHLHSDHVVGIPDLLLIGWLRTRARPFRVWGPAGASDMMSHLEKAFQFDIHIRRDIDEMLAPDGIVIESNDVQQGVVYENNGVKITAFDVDHGPVKPALGYRIDYQGRSVVLSGDTRFSENLIDFAKGVDLLVHEVIVPKAFVARIGYLTDQQLQQIIDHHLTPEEAGEVFSRASPKLAVYSHIVSGKGGFEELVEGTRKTYSGPFEIGEDLMSFEIGDEIKIGRFDLIHEDRDPW